MPGARTKARGQGKDAAADAPVLWFDEPVDIPALEEVLSHRVGGAGARSTHPAGRAAVPTLPSSRCAVCNARSVCHPPEYIAQDCRDFGRHYAATARAPKSTRPRRSGRDARRPNALQAFLPSPSHVWIPSRRALGVTPDTGSIHRM